MLAATSTSPKPLSRLKTALGRPPCARTASQTALMFSIRWAKRYPFRTTSPFRLYAPSVNFSSTQGMSDILSYVTGTLVVCPNFHRIWASFQPSKVILSISSYRKMYSISLGELHRVFQASAFCAAFAFGLSSTANTFSSFSWSCLNAPFTARSTYFV